MRPLSTQARLQAQRPVFGHLRTCISLALHPHLRALSLAPLTRCGHGSEGASLRLAIPAAPPLRVARTGWRGPRGLLQVLHAGDAPRPPHPHRRCTPPPRSGGAPRGVSPLGRPTDAPERVCPSRAARAPAKAVGRMRGQWRRRPGESGALVGEQLAARSGCVGVVGQESPTRSMWP